MSDWNFFNHQQRFILCLSLIWGLVIVLSVVAVCANWSNVATHGCH